MSGEDRVTAEMGFNRLDVDPALGGLCIIAGETIRHSLYIEVVPRRSWRFRNCRLVQAFLLPLRLFAWWSFLRSFDLPLIITFFDVEITRISRCVHVPQIRSHPLSSDHSRVLKLQHESL
ncbi:hypothetical protein F2Q69_00014683 [Brassica cretica]|uniref:Uncharacterized protein n=1 Tax=Brassica cretica TaxID=69181 RepID=A0A8S9QXD1_BRACR|nr:hypothetical protein F2Q69_00014683 [Brassica cretica]